MTGTRVEADHPWLLPATLLAEGDAPGPVRRTTRDWVVDWLAFLLAIAGGVFVYVLMTTNRQADPESLYGITEVVAILPAAAALWLRRRWPVGITISLSLSGAVLATPAFAAGIALFTVAVHRRLGVTVAVTVLQVAATVPFQLMHPDPRSPLWQTTLFSTIITLAITAFGLFVRARRQLVTSLRDRVERAETEQRLRVEQARHMERERIAREMHDVLAHRMSLLSLHAGALEYHRDAPPDIARAAGVIRSTAHQALEDLRGVIGVLRAGDVTPGTEGGERAPERPQPTLADLATLVEESRRAGMRVSLSAEAGDPAGVPEALGRNAYRIVQEGLTNVRKHAPGCTAEVEVRGAPGDGLSVSIVNRLPAGGGARPQSLGPYRPSRPGSGPVTGQVPDLPGSGAGLVGLTERASLAGGSLEYGRNADGDFRLHVWLPWR